jgi:hypothetical protein
MKQEISEKEKTDNRRNRKDCSEKKGKGEKNLFERCNLFLFPEL